MGPLAYAFGYVLSLKDKELKLTQEIHEWLCHISLMAGTEAVSKLSSTI